MIGHSAKSHSTDYSVFPCMLIYSLHKNTQKNTLSRLEFRLNTQIFDPRPLNKDKKGLRYLSLTTIVAKGILQ